MFAKSRPPIYPVKYRTSTRELGKRAEMLEVGFPLPALTRRVPGASDRDGVFPI